jgi:hypothetical protein
MAHLVLSSWDEDIVHIEARQSGGFRKVPVLLRQPPHVGAAQLHSAGLHANQACSASESNRQLRAHTVSGLVCRALQCDWQA